MRHSHLLVIPFVMLRLAAVPSMAGSEWGSLGPNQVDRTEEVVRFASMQLEMVAEDPAPPGVSDRRSAFLSCTQATTAYLLGMVGYHESEFGSAVAQVIARSLSRITNYLEAHFPARAPQAASARPAADVSAGIAFVRRELEAIRAALGPRPAR